MRQRYEIISHLKKKDWKAQWHEKVVEYTKENKKIILRTTAISENLQVKMSFMFSITENFKMRLWQLISEEGLSRPQTAVRLPGLFLEENSDDIFIFCDGTDRLYSSGIFDNRPV